MAACSSDDEQPGNAADSSTTTATDSQATSGTDGAQPTDATNGAAGSADASATPGTGGSQSTTPGTGDGASDPSAGMEVPQGSDSDTDANAGDGTGGTGGAGAAGATASAGSGGADGAGDDDPGVSSGTRPLSSTLGLPTMMESPGVAPYFHVWRPSDLAAVEGPLPVMVWNNGACSRNDGVFKPLFEKWASGGYVVLSLTSGGGSSMTTTDDQQGLIDWVVAQAEMTGGPYDGKLDLDRIAAGGNSCGGITSLDLASKDDRIAAVFVLSGSSAVGSPNRTVINGIKVPVAYAVGGQEDIARANAEADYEAFADGLPAMIVKRSSGDHLMISNNAMVMNEAADFSIHWLDLSMFGLQEALDALQAPTLCEGCQADLWTATSKNLESLVP